MCLVRVGALVGVVVWVQVVVLLGFSVVVAFRIVRWKMFGCSRSRSFMLFYLGLAYWTGLGCGLGCGLGSVYWTVFGCWRQMCWG